MSREDIGFAREFGNTLKWMVLFCLAFVAIIVPFFLLVNVASDRLGALGIVLAVVLLLMVTALAMTIAGRVSRRRIAERYERKLASTTPRGQAR